jgi:hypothetical protein
MFRSSTAVVIVIQTVTLKSCWWEANGLGHAIGCAPDALEVHLQESRLSSTGDQDWSQVLSLWSRSSHSITGTVQSTPPVYQHKFSRRVKSLWELTSWLSTRSDAGHREVKWHCYCAMQFLYEVVSASTYALSRLFQRYRCKRILIGTCLKPWPRC